MNELIGPAVALLGLMVTFLLVLTLWARRLPPVERSQPMIVLDGDTAHLYTIVQGRWRHVGTWPRDDRDFPWADLVGSHRLPGAVSALLDAQAPRGTLPPDLVDALRRLQVDSAWRHSLDFCGIRAGDLLTDAVVMTVRTALPDRFRFENLQTDEVPL